MQPIANPIEPYIIIAVVGVIIVCGGESHQTSKQQSVTGKGRRRGREGKEKKGDGREEKGREGRMYRDVRGRGAATAPRPDPPIQTYPA